MLCMSGKHPQEKWLIGVMVELALLMSQLHDSHTADGTNMLD